ncbi:hypothetical protein [Legionella impletisoli]|uniref:Uncharacterized protein n=1 Tax=Legionella impletisoli TaxID=343510 RepID=A0A917JPI8_9GAMM|nr:hypothetical protein [Legionella impletisoli]GGI80283.1 hypothetical protein GCM10007966_05990 [Legionella impletisoli]
MSRFTKALIGASLSLAAAASFALPPTELVSHNNTDVSSQAYLGPNLDIPQQPTAPGAVKRVSWVSVRILCMNTPKPGICPAKIALNTTPQTTLGVVELNLATGDINPKVLSANGYKMTVIKPGEIAFTKGA